LRENWIKYVAILQTYGGVLDGRFVGQTTLYNRLNILSASKCSLTGWLGGITGSASDQRSEGCGFEAY